MNVYLRTEEGLDLIGRTSLAEEAGSIYVVDLDLVGWGATLRLTYELRSVPYLTPELKLETERAVVLAFGQTPDFLPGWERIE